MFGGQNACFISEYYHYQYVSKTLNRVWLGFSNLPTPGPSQEGSAERKERFLSLKQDVPDALAKDVPDARLQSGKTSVGKVRKSTKVKL